MSWHDTVRTSYGAPTGSLIGSAPVASMPISLAKEKSWFSLTAEQAASSCMDCRVHGGTWTADVLHVQGAGELSRHRIDSAREGNILQTILVQRQVADIDAGAMRATRAFTFVSHGPAGPFKGTARRRESLV